MARACSSGALYHCTCALPPYALPEGNFKWGGCGDNVRWGTQFAKQFVDSAEREEIKVVKKVRDADENDEGIIKEKHAFKSKNYVSSMNLHNNKVGRRVKYLELLIVV